MALLQHPCPGAAPAAGVITPRGLTPPRGPGLCRQGHGVTAFFRGCGSKTRRQEDHQAAEGRVDRLLVEVLNAVDEATSVHGEWDPIQAAAAHHTGKAVRMISLPCGSENPLHDGLGANAALLQGPAEKPRGQSLGRRTKTGLGEQRRGGASRLGLPLPSALSLAGNH